LLARAMDLRAQQYRLANKFAPTVEMHFLLERVGGIPTCPRRTMMRCVCATVAPLSRASAAPTGIAGHLLEPGLSAKNAGAVCLTDRVD